MTLSIVQANLNDAEKILDLQKLAYRSEAILYEDWNIAPLTQTLAEIESEFEDKHFLKATKNDQLIGSVRASYDLDTCYIGRLIVHPKFQQQGIGTLLIKRIENAFSNAKRFELFTGSKSIVNIRLYQRFGYKIFKEKELSPAVRIVIMEKRSEQNGLQSRTGPKSKNPS